MKRPLSKGKTTDPADVDTFFLSAISVMPRNKYASSYAAGSVVVVLEPDVAAVSRRRV